LQARYRLVHALARRQLAPDRKPRVPDNQDTAPRVGEPDSAKKDIRPSKRWILVDAEFRHTRSPCLRFEQRNLPTTGPINTACNTLIGY
jgi:hypothetical protein